MIAISLPTLFRGREIACSEIMENLIDRYANKIQGTLSCLDRVVLIGIIPGICYAEAMSRLLGTKGIRIFDYTKWAEPAGDDGGFQSPVS